LRLELSTNVAAPSERVWATIMDVERWPEWTASVTSVEKLEPGELKLGSRVRVKQPKLPPVVWTITVLEPGRRMEWQAKGPGSNTVAWHAAEPEGSGSKATLGIDQGGLFFKLTGWYFAKMTREYVGMELEGLKRRSEGAS
jgi:uncharacterized membrane protein